MRYLLKALVAVCAMSVWSGVSAGVIVGDKEWRQLTETADFSYAEFSGVCDPLTGTCAGSTGGVDFNGWTWASQTEVAQLVQ